jgi:phosphoribosylglycinamide formyltransferase-1
VGATAVLVSGTGSILEAILDDGQAVAVVVSDRPCRGLEVAAARGVEALEVTRADHGGFGASFDRDGYTAAVMGALGAREVDLVCLAGFGTVLSPVFFDAYGGRVLNTHPSLLPAFPGWHAVRDAMAAGAAVTGCTVHLATAAVDDGPILRQREVAVREDDDESSLHERIKEVERELYPAVIRDVRAALDRGDDPASLAGAAGVGGR